MQNIMERVVRVLVFSALLVLGYCGQTAMAAGCSGLRRILLGNVSGVVTDGKGFYEENVHCQWLIEAPDPNMTITLNFNEFETECTYDFLTIYDGNSFTSPVLGTFSGNLLPGPVRAKSGKMLIHLYSDTNYSLNGTTAMYEIQNCSNDCSRHGTCVNYKCVCDAGYAGVSCEWMACPYECGFSSGRGQCDFMSPVQKCVCSPGFVGEGCSLSTANNTGWGDTVLVSSGIDSVFTTRTGHTAEYHDTTDSLWVFGGYDLNGVLDDLVRFNFTSNQWEKQMLTTALRPTGRYAHSMVLYNNQLIVFGGILANGTLTNELWSFSIASRTWRLLPSGSDLSSVPPGLADHSGTIVNFSHLFVFGGRSQNLNFEDGIFKYDLNLRSGWEVIRPLGGREVDVRVRGHSTVYHLDSQSLIVFGGFRPSSTRLSKRSSEIYAFHVGKYYWMKWSVDVMSAPMGRAFHSANILGNYMVVYGGNVHLHYSNTTSHSPFSHERCYDSQIQLFHLGCHKWVDFHTLSQDFKSSSEAEHVLTNIRGRFGHATAVRDGSTLLIVGGYNGPVLRDLLAIKMPGTVAVNSKLGSSVAIHCHLHVTTLNCLSDPNCEWCPTDNRCLGHSQQSSCSETQIFTPGNCPGVCNSLVTCEACIIWGRGVPTSPDPMGSRVNEQCGWCVQEQRCYRIGEASRACSDQPSNSGSTGWWGINGTFLTEFSQCRLHDMPPGITWIKYRHPQNLTQPDEVSVVKVTDQTFSFNSDSIKEERTNGGNFIAEYKGFLRPNGALTTGGAPLHVWMGSSNAIASLYISRDDSPHNVEKVAYSASMNEFLSKAKRQDEDMAIFPDTSKGAAFYILQEERQVVSSIKEVRSVMDLKWNGNLPEGLNPQPFTKEYLQPFYSDSCDNYVTCSGCLTDAACGWCPTSQTCELRDGPLVSVDRCGTATGSVTHHLIIEWNQCTDCRLYMDCLSCARNSLCEWLVSEEGASCTRRGRFPYSVTDPSQCSMSCNEYTDCENCTKHTKECAWCEVTKTCFMFGTFITSYTYGQCANWFDYNKACPTCAAHTDCKSCLSNFRCGWCGNRDNPTLGNCQGGNFGGPDTRDTCSVLVARQYNISETEPTDWSYEVCPDVEECMLGLDDCHENATCTNTFDAYECTCKRGFEGNGRDECVKTCYHECIHGHCSEAPDYICICDVGWTGINCSTECGCNFHSSCITGIGICDECIYWSMGEHCELCRPGSYGNATDQSRGCRECECNGHGDPAVGICDNTTGICYCTENSKGENCEDCVSGFYHDPRFPEHCSLECTGRMLLTNVESSALGSGREDQPYCLWVLTVGDSLSDTAAMIHPPSISLTIEGLEALCGRDYVYVYDGIPDYLATTHPENGTSIGNFCGQDPLKRVTTVAYSGTMTVVYQANRTAGAESPGFAASYTVNRCPGACGGNRECILGVCQCRDGYQGPDCQTEACPSNCSAAVGQGMCNKEMGLCDCSPGFGGDGCQYATAPLGALRQGVWTLLADEGRLDPDSSATAGSVPYARTGHSIVTSNSGMLWLFGGYSNKYGDLNDIWSYDLSTKQWRRHFSSSSVHPAPRRYHAAAFSASYIMISGGMTDDTVMSDVWFFSTVSENWSQIPADYPSLAGHSLTVIKDDTLVTIGGYSPSSGLLDHVLELTLASQWRSVPTKGTPPTGLFGHSAVWHSATNSLYVYGGNLFYLESISSSDKLYSLDYRGKVKIWSLLPPEPTNRQLPNIFHAAVTTLDYMVMIGGGTPTHNHSNTLMAYHYDCNHWLDLNEFVVGDPPPASAFSSATVTTDGTIYTFGGEDGTLIGALRQLSLPPDLCALQRTADGCRSMLGCAACVETNHTQNLLFCKSISDVDSSSCHGDYTLELGARCDDARVEMRNCRAASSCAECLMTHPAYPNAEQTCKWCSKCPDGACIAVHLNCLEEHDCKLDSQKEITVSSDCLDLNCEASDCPKCTVGRGCIWTRQFKRASEIRRLLNPSPIYDWNCFSATLLDIAPDTIHIISVPPDQCPLPCQAHTSCPDCLESKGSDGGWQECFWSARLNKCLSPTYAPLACANGACGPLTHSGSSNCPRPCYWNRQCAHCLRQPGCGWCAVGEGNGTGVCMEGGLYQPTGGVCSDGKVGLYDVLLEEVTVITPDDLKTPLAWTYMSCPPENECLNGHHDCWENQECNDTLTSYKCNCKLGYTQQSEGDACMPVCSPACQHGTCVEPDVCQCHFSYVGRDCSVECECNGHSTCAGPDAVNRTECLQCRNNTQGQRCEQCLPLFTGKAVNGGECVRCLSYCNGNSRICLSEADFNRSRDVGLSLSLKNVETYFPIGPVIGAICVDCGNFSAGLLCESCVDGYFKDGHHCRPCQCNGHWDRCDKTTGKDCQCGNNTDTPRCPTEKYPSPCWQHQCSICEELFIGEPIDGHQCYRQMHVDQDTCFDPETQTNCPLDSSPLLLGRTSFFVVQPKFTNLDIRLTIDVTVGALDIYLTYSYKFFRIITNRTTGWHTVELDDNANLYSKVYRSKRRPSRERRNTVQEIDTSADELQALTASAEPPVYNTLMEYLSSDSINTFVTITDPLFVAIIRGVHNRLVVTLPHSVHDFKSRKFYIVLFSQREKSATGVHDKNASATNGIMYFQQDQPHIDLFVFFSVFLSCFFLFLAILVVVWKVKVCLEARNDRQRRALEMEHRASRPIGHVLLYIEDLPMTARVKGASTTSRRHSKMKKHAAESTAASRQTTPSSKSFSRSGIAWEPTENEMAAVATTVFSLPGGSAAPVQACLGSALVVMKPSPRTEPPQPQLRPMRFAGSKSGMCREMRM